MMRGMTRRNWAPIIERAAQLVNGYSYLITLRQLHYLLVAESSGVELDDGTWFISRYRNNGDDYDRLSELTAQARRDGWFPSLLDQTRSIDVAPNWASPSDALRAIAQQYRRDRTEGQEWCVVLGGEKATLLAQLRGWFRNLGIPIVLLRGYGSQTYLDDVAEMVTDDGRPAVLIYAGDLDASGYDILRDFIERCPVFDETEHIATRPEHIARFGLPINQGKGQDSRARSFRDEFSDLADYADRQVADPEAREWVVQRSPARPGHPSIILPNVVQIETEAIPPDDLRALYQGAIDQYWDTPTYEAMLEDEQIERDRLIELADDEEAA